MPAVGSCCVAASSRRPARRPAVVRADVSDLRACRARCAPTTGRRLRRRAPGRLSRLAVWWLKLGIQLDRIDPGHPEQNGRHERFHLDVADGGDHVRQRRRSRQQQRRFDRVRQDSTTMRPHEALAQTPPARVYQASPRPYPARLEDPWYDATCQVRRVRPNGQIKWQGDLVFVSEAVCGRSSRTGRDRERAIGPSTSWTSNWGASIDRPGNSRARGTAGASVSAARSRGNAVPVDLTDRGPPDLEISPRPRDSHIPTADRRRRRYETGSEKVLPMCPV